MTAQRNFVDNAKKGFTLIELLIVMAILGVLAVVVLVAINPAEQLRRARDAGRVSGVQQIGRAMQAYYTVNAALPTEATWGTALTASEELQVIPAAITATGYTPCAVGSTPSNNWCYSVAASGEDFIVTAVLESDQRSQQCAGAGSTVPYAVYSSIDARGGVVCGAPAAGTNLTFVQ